MGRPPPALRGHRRRRDERPRARRARARRDGDRLRPRGRLAVRGALRAAGIEPVVGHDAANVPDGAEVVVLERDPARQPRARAPRRGRELHRADLLGELTRLRPTIAVTGTHGKTTTSSMLVHALRGCGLDPGYLVGGEVRSTGSNAGWGTGEWLVVEADESDRSLLKLAPADRGAHQRRARPPHDLRLAARRRRRRSARSSALARARGRAGTGRSCSALAGGGRASAVRRRRPSSTPGGSRFDARRRRGRAAGAGRPQRAQRRRRADRDAGSPAPTSPPPRPRCATSRAPGRRFERARHDRRRARSWSTTTPTTRPRSRATIEAARTLGPRRRRRRLPAAPVLAHAAPGARVRRRARARRPRRGARRSTRRASAPRTSPASPACSSPRRPPTRRGGKRVAWLPDFDAAEALPARRAARGRPAADARRGRRRRARAGAALAGTGRRVEAAPERSTDRHSPRPALARAVGRRSLLALAAAAGCGCATPRSSRSATSTITGVDRLRRRRRSAPRSRPPRSDMTTLHVREDALRDAVAQFPLGRGPAASDADFPHRLTHRGARARAGRRARDRRPAASRSPATGCCCAASTPTATCPILRADAARPPASA